MSVMRYQTNDGQSVVLGSGYLYASLASEIADPFNLTPAEEAALVNIGYILDNATLTAKSNKTYATAANAGRIISWDTDKEVSFSTGIISWNLEHVAKFLTGSEYEEVGTSKKYSFGANDTAPTVFLRFVSTDEASEKKITIDMFNACYSGALTLDFNKSDPITFDYTFDLLSRENPISRKFEYFNITDSNTTSATALTGITITTPPTTVTYEVGDALDLTGMVITASYSNNTTAAVTNYVTDPPSGTVLAATNRSINIVYIEDGVIKTAIQNITVE